MLQYRTKPVVLRGNSGSGNNTVVKAIHAASQSKVAIVEQTVGKILSETGL